MYSPTASIKSSPSSVSSQNDELQMTMKDSSVTEEPCASPKTSYVLNKQDEVPPKKHRRSNT